MNFAASKHICKDEEMLDTLKIDGEFNHFKLENSRKIKVEGTRSVKMKLHDGTIQDLQVQQGPDPALED